MLDVHWAAHQMYQVFENVKEEHHEAFGSIFLRAVVKLEKTTHLE